MQQDPTAIIRAAVAKRAGNRLPTGIFKDSHYYLRVTEFKDIFDTSDSLINSAIWDVLGLYVYFLTAEHNLLH